VAVDALNKMDGPLIRLLPVQRAIHLVRQPKAAPGPLSYSAARSAGSDNLAGCFLILGVTAYLVSHRTTSALVQGDATTIGLGGVTVSVVGAALFVRYSLTAFLRFWMARQSYDLTLLGDRLLDSGAARGLAGTDQHDR
jgi:hypothetical protein